MDPTDFFGVRASVMGVSMSLAPTAIRTELGWEPKWDLDRGLRAAWEWYERTLG